MKQQVRRPILATHTVVLLQMMICVLMAGCGGSVKFASDTIMDENGDVVRITRLSTPGDRGYERLQSVYDLPSGGTWTEIEKDPSATTEESAAPKLFYSRIYEVTRRFAAGESIAPDFTRRGSSGTKAARNRITTRVRHYWFADTYQYEETFKDVVTEARLTAAVRQLYAVLTLTLAEEVSRLPDADFTTQEAINLLKARADPIVERFLNVFRAQCVDTTVSMDVCGEAIGQDTELSAYPEIFEDEDVLLDELVAIFPPPAAVDPDDWDDSLSLELPNRLGEREDLGELFDSLEEEIFGVHGLLIFDSYPFEISLSLPGNYVASNADVRESGILKWAFREGEFWLHEHTLYARSRNVHWGRVLFALTLPAAFSGIFWIRKRQVKSQR